MQQVPLAPQPEPAQQSASELQAPLTGAHWQVPSQRPWQQSSLHAAPKATQQPPLTQVSFARQQSASVPHDPVPLVEQAQLPDTQLPVQQSALPMQAPLPVRQQASPALHARPVPQSAFDWQGPPRTVPPVLPPVLPPELPPPELPPATPTVVPPFPPAPVVPIVPPSGLPPVPAPLLEFPPAPWPVVPTPPLEPGLPLELAPPELPPPMGPPLDPPDDAVPADDVEPAAPPVLDAVPDAVLDGPASFASPLALKQAGRYASPAAAVSQATLLIEPMTQLRPARRPRQPREARPRCFAR
jgi:hypothetical protein